jgi:hypothetical protein
MARNLPKVGTNLRPYDGMRRNPAKVTGYAKMAGRETRIKLRHLSGNRTTASLKHLTETFYDWS